MGRVFERVKAAVEAEKYVFSVHADERLRERGIVARQVVAGLGSGKSLMERPDAHPNPAAEVEQTLPDGTKFKAVWAWLKSSDAAKLVTVHFFDR
jgi:hypothetical protein